MKSLSFLIKLSSLNLLKSHWTDLIQKEYGIKSCVYKDEVKDVDNIYQQVYYILRLMPPQLVKDCNVKEMNIQWLGENKEFYPNHGWFRESDQSLTLNSDIFYNPDMPKDFIDSRGYGVWRPASTLTHEFGHAYDYHQGYLSEKPAWMKLSGWSKTPKPGLKRLIINEPGMPQVVGEMYYDPKAGFTRFYAKRNPWDDFADCFSFYVTGLAAKMPDNKVKYFDDLLAKYKPQV